MQFEDLNAWRKARELTNAIYALCRQPRLAADFGLKDQLQRAAVSAMSNLAEGFERGHASEKLQYWNVARASAGEVRSLLYVVLDNQLAEPAEVAALQSLTGEVGALTSGLMKSFASRSASSSQSSP